MITGRRDFIKKSALATAGIIVGCSVNKKFDVIVKNALIVDGSGSEPFISDIGINDNKITAIAKNLSTSAEKVIYADNYVLSPGFIDIHTHTDTELIINPNADSKIFQGVTTEIGGNCGYSPFPLNAPDLTEFDKNLYEKYEIHADWNNLDGFYKSLENSGISINYASFTGHGNIRAFVIGKNDVAPSKLELESMKNALAQSIEMGSLGLSTGLEYSPGSYAKTNELVELCRIVAEKNGVYSTHMRNEDDTVEEAIEEALTISRKTGVSLQISHLKAGNPANWHKVDNMLKMIENEYNNGMNVHADRYPYIAYGTGLSTFLPLWSRQGDTDDLIARLKDESQISEIKKYALSRANRIGGWDKVVISSCFNDGNKKYEGKNIKECAENENTDEFTFVKNLIIDDRNRVSIIGFAMEEGNLKKILAHPLVMIGSDGNAVCPTGKLSDGKPHPRYYGTFPRVLGKYARDEKIMSLQTAVKKMTSMPAEKLGLKKRGLIQKGYFADIVIFDQHKIADKATFVQPHQLAQGVKFVFVNGKVVIEDGKHNGEKSGQIIRHS